MALQLPSALLPRIYGSAEPGPSRVLANLAPTANLWEVIKCFEAQGLNLTSLYDEGAFLMPVLVEIQREFADLSQLVCNSMELW